MVSSVPTTHFLGKANAGSSKQPFIISTADRRQMQKKKSPHDQSDICICFLLQLFFKINGVQWFHQSQLHIFRANPWLHPPKNHLSFRPATGGQNAKKKKLPHDQSDICIYAFCCNCALKSMVFNGFISPNFTFFGQIHRCCILQRTIYYFDRRQEAKMQNWPCFFSIFWMSFNRSFPNPLMACQTFAYRLFAFAF